MNLNLVIMKTYQFWYSTKTCCCKISWNLDRPRLVLRATWLLWNLTTLKRLKYQNNVIWTLNLGAVKTDINTQTHNAKITCVLRYVVTHLLRSAFARELRHMEYLLLYRLCGTCIILIAIRNLFRCNLATCGFDNDLDCATFPLHSSGIRQIVCHYGSARDCRWLWKMVWMRHDDVIEWKHFQLFV